MLWALDLIACHVFPLNCRLSTLLYLQDRFDESLSHLQRLNSLSPNSVHARTLTAITHAHLGQVGSLWCCFSFPSFLIPLPLPIAARRCSNASRHCIECAAKLEAESRQHNSTFTVH